MKKETWWEKQNATVPDNTNKYKQFNPKLGAITLMGIFMLMVATLIAGLVFGPNLNKEKLSEANSIVSPISINESIAQCNGNFQFNPSEQNYGLIPPEYTEKNIVISKDSRDYNMNDKGRILPIQPMNIPAYGYFFKWDEKEKNSIKNKVYYVGDKINGEKINKDLFPYYLGYLWDGGTIIWYNPSKLKTHEIETLKLFYDEISQEQGKVAILPWYKDSQIPLNKTFAFSSWNVTKHCNELDLDIFKDYIAFAKENRRAPVGEAPFAPLKENGDLYEIDPKRFSNFKFK